MNSSHRQVEALWNIVSESGGRVGFVNWWATWPAETVQGYIVSDYFARTDPAEKIEGTTFPPDLGARLEPELRRGEWPWLAQVLTDGKLKLFSDRKREQGSASAFESRDKLAWFFYGPDIIGERAALHLLASEPKPDLFGLISRKGDLASHYMWEFAASRELADISRVLEPVYEYEDEMLGRFLQEVGPQANVIILSDHGFAWEGEQFNHTGTAPDGIFIASGPSFKKGLSLPRVTLYDIAPTVLHVLGLPVAKDMAHEPLVAALASEAPVQWVETYETGRLRKTAKSPIEDRLLEELRTLGYVK